MSARPRLEVYADGSGQERVNTPGGWAFALVCADELIAQGTGAAKKTTCLIMELEAARAGLAAVQKRRLHRTHEVVLITDSKIALDIAAGTFMPKPPKYRALATALREIAEALSAEMKWVRGHSGQRWNEHVDALARAAKLMRSTED